LRSYLYSILTRFYLAFSGFLVFLLSAALFGANGRGIIGFGTSVFAISSIIFSANLGRSFLALTHQNEKLKKELLSRFLKLNCLLSLGAALVGLTYWYLSSSAREILSPSQALCFSLTSVFYVWSINGNAFFASLMATKKQENIILITRSCLILLLVILFATKEKSIDYFIVLYSSLLFLGSMAEILYLFFQCGSDEKVLIKPNVVIIKESLFHHLDFLSFNIFPLFLTVLLASYVSKSEVGRFNFALQIINLVFLFSTTANIRLITYVSDVGYKARLSQYKKLFWATLAISMFSTLFLSLMLNLVTTYAHFEQFRGVEWLFITCGLSIPGYVIYQSLSPIWIELHKQKQAAKLHSINFVIFLSISPLIISNFKLVGAAWLFALFHCGLVMTQLHLYRRYAKT
jgi:O-antigen/teichoic acid export membrane protein